MPTMKNSLHRPRRLSRCFNVADLRTLAKARLPAPIFHYLDGGADDERSLARNTAAFDDYELQPESLTDVSHIDLSTQLLGRTVKVPFLLAPTGMSRLFHYEAEGAVARAAERAGTFYSLSTMATTSLEEIARISAGPRIFQLYLFKDRELTREFVQRCQAANYDALCLTIDTPLAGNRERDLVTGMVIPPRFTASSFLSFVARPRWTGRLLTHPRFQLENVAHRVDALNSSLLSIMEYAGSQFDRSITWQDVEWLRSQWPGPLIVKGVQSLTDARNAAAAGATALMLSNHGGRQLDGVSAPIDLLPRVRDALTDVELIVDGGVRRGTHIIKALALGANACSIGRAYLYGLAAGGQRGVEHALGLLTAELQRSMALLGCPSVAALSSRFVQRTRD